MSSSSLVTFNSIDDMRIYAKQYHLDLIAYKNVVYDVSSFYHHPGSYRALIKYSRMDVTHIIEEIPQHRNMKKVLWKMNQFKFGYINPQIRSITQLITIPHHPQSQIEIVRKYLLKDADSKLNSKERKRERIYSEEGIQTVPSFQCHMRSISNRKSIFR